MKTQCPNCKVKFNVDDRFAGKQAKCPKCVKPFTIQPFIETPVTIDPPATVQKSVETPIQKTEPVAPPATIAPPVSPPIKSPEPVEKEKPETKATSKGLSKTVFVYCWIAVRIIAGVLGGLGLMMAIRKEAHSTLVMTFAAADVFLVCSVAIELALFYKMWAAIADNQASITPAKAVGFLFIPVFNIYWALCMFTGFAEDYNSFIHRQSIKTKDLSFMLFLVYAFAFILATLTVTIPMICVFAILRLIPKAFASYPEQAWALLAFAIAAGVIHFIMYVLFATKTCNAINALPDYAKQ